MDSLDAYDTIGQKVRSFGSEEVAHDEVGGCNSVRNSVHPGWRAARRAVAQSTNAWPSADGRLRMTERYTRRNLGNLDVEITLSDSGAYARPWTIKVRAELAPDTEMIEFVCTLCLPPRILQLALKCKL